MKKAYFNQLVKLADYFEKKIKLAQESSIDEQINKLRFDRFDGTDGALLEAAFSILPQADQQRLMEYTKEKYPYKNENEDRSSAILADPWVMSILNPILDKIKKRWDQWKQSHIDADKEIDQFESKKQEDKDVDAQRNKTRRPLTDQDLQILNFRTTHQLDINRAVKSLANPQVKGQVTVKLVISPNLTLDYLIDFSGTGLDDVAKYKITNGLHQYDNAIKTELTNKMYTQNKYIEKPLVTILWQGTL